MKSCSRQHEPALHWGLDLCTKVLDSGFKSSQVIMISWIGSEATLSKLPIRVSALKLTAPSSPLCLTAVAVAAAGQITHWYFSLYEQMISPIVEDSSPRPSVSIRDAAASVARKHF